MVDAAPRSGDVRPRERNGEPVQGHIPAHHSDLSTSHPGLLRRPAASTSFLLFSVPPWCLKRFDGFTRFTGSRGSGSGSGVRHIQRTAHDGNARGNIGNTRGSTRTSLANCRNSRGRHTHRTGRIANSLGEHLEHVGEHKNRPETSRHGSGTSRNASGTAGNAPESTVNSSGASGQGRISGIGRTGGTRAMVARRKPATHFRVRRS
jgi:hypothetical protein